MKALRTLLILFFFTAQTVYSQKSTLNIDSIFNTAITFAKAGEYNKAIAESNEALLADSQRGDILVYLANIYSWKEQNDSALLNIEKARSLKYTGNDLYETWTNILYRQHKYVELLSICNEAEKNSYDKKDDLLQKRLIAYTNLKDYNNAIRLAEDPINSTLIKEEPISSVYNAVLLKSSKESLTLNFINESFDSIPSHYVGSIGYFTKLGEHTLGFSINYANRFSRKDVQLESDFYLQMINEQYIYFNYGFAINGYLFPKHRLGMEYYFPVTKRTNASLGLRYMYYQGSINPNLYIVTAHLEKSFGKNNFAIRPYYVIKKDQQSLSFISEFKHLGKNEREYWGLEFGFGNSPDDIYVTQQTGGFNQLSAYIYKIKKSFFVSRMSDLLVQLGYTSEQYNQLSPTNFRNRYTLELGYKIHFR